MKIKIALKIVAFLAVFILLFNMASSLLLTADKINYHTIGGFYEEPQDSLDAVYIGSSNCFTFWNSLLAWGEYGISVYPYAGNSFLFFATEYYIREARKTQPDALYIVNVNSLTDGEIDLKQMRNMIDSMPPSLNKLQMIHRLIEIGDFSVGDSMEFYLPIIRFHSRWKDLTAADAELPLDGRKGAASFEQYLNTSVDISEGYVLTDKESTLSEKLLESTDRLLDYCEKEKVNVLFVTVPQAKLEDFRVERINALNAHIASKGFPVLDLFSDPMAQGIDIKTDYYNTAHTNIHGSVKYTYHLAEYLIENYNFIDKRQDTEYEEWNQAYASYVKEVSPYILDIELDAHNRDYSMMAPALNVALQGNGNGLSWQGVEGAEGYIIYKKSSSDPSWKAVGESESLSFFDHEVEVNTLYTYTVLPYKESKSGRLYGKYSYAGSSLQR